jgi:hypothetical protein
MDLEESFWTAYWEIPARAGQTVAVLWFALAVSGRWETDRGWIDRAGRILGVFWLVEAPIWWF